jgi:Na+/H+ antiporter NhaC
MTRRNDMKLNEREAKEIQVLKEQVGSVLHGQNGAFTMLVLTCLIGDAGAQWREGSTKQAFIAEVVEAVSMWYDFYAEDDEEDEDE